MGASVKFLVTSVLIFNLLATKSSSVAAADSDSLQGIAEATAAFTSDMYDVLRMTPKNLVSSPLSASAALAMLYAGAQGDTKAFIRAALKLDKFSDQDLFDGYRNLMEQLKDLPDSSKATTLDIANNVFPSEDHPLQPSFTSVLDTHFGVKPEQVNYQKNPGGAADKINTFVSRMTRDKIKKLVSASDFDFYTRLVLVNAIYFKGSWRTPFDKKLTTSKPFHVSDKEKVDVDMMFRSGKMQYADIKELNAQVVQLPYQGHRDSMLIILPSDKTGLSDMETKLKSVPLQTVLYKLSTRDVDLQLPRFKIESRIDLDKSFTKLGAGIIFDPAANFSGILQEKPGSRKPEKLFVSKAIQKAFMEVDEVGTVAAAATAVTMVGMSMPMAPLPTVSFVADHPFFVAIVTRVSKKQVPLFVARVVNPKK